MKKAQKLLSDALLCRMGKLERRLERQYLRYVNRFVPTDDCACANLFSQWVEGEDAAIELEAHKEAFYALPINNQP